MTSVCLLVVLLFSKKYNIYIFFQKLKLRFWDEEYRKPTRVSNFETVAIPSSYISKQPIYSTSNSQLLILEDLFVKLGLQKIFHKYFDHFLNMLKTFAMNYFLGLKMIN